MVPLGVESAGEVGNFVWRAHAFDVVVTGYEATLDQKVLCQEGSNLGENLAVVSPETVEAVHFGQMGPVSKVCEYGVEYVVFCGLTGDEVKEPGGESLCRAS